MAIIPVMDFFCKLLLQLRKTHHIQSLENVSAMRWVGNEFNVELPSFLKELKGEVQGVPIKKNDLRTTICFPMSGRIKVFDEPIQGNSAICPTIF
jgi:hypothetical protein